jgi:hypothetical protein
MAEEGAGVGRTAETRRQFLDVMSLEYISLRSEIGERTERRFQTVTVFLAAGALLAGVKQGDLNVAVVGLAAALVLAGAVVWVSAGRSIGRVSAHLAELEKRIDDLIDPDDFQPPLTWERRRQERRGWNKFWFGAGASRGVWWPRPPKAE